MTLINPETMKDENGNQYYICIDADCPGCKFPERRFDGNEFSCKKCSYRSKERNR